MLFSVEMRRACQQCVLLFVVYLLHANGMAAPCTERGSTAAMIIPAPNLTVTRNVPVGTVLGEVSSATSSYWVDCSTPNNVRTSATVRPPRGRVTGVMSVMGRDGELIPGLGVRLTHSSNMVSASTSSRGGCRGAGSALPGNTGQYSCDIYNVNNGVRVGGEFGLSPLKLTFIKTSEALTSAALAREVVFTTRIDNYSTISYQLDGGTVVVNPCTFNIPSVVPLGSVSVATMQANRNSEQRDFNMEMNCQNSAMVKIRFTPAAGSTAVRGSVGTLSNTAAAREAAAGVNVQLLSAAGEPVPLDADIDFGAQPATARYSFRARMTAAPGATVTAGRVTAGAEVNFIFY